MTASPFGELGGDYFVSARSWGNLRRSCIDLHRSAKFVYESSILSNEKSYKSSDAYDEHLFREATHGRFPSIQSQLPTSQSDGEGLLVN